MWNFAHALPRDIAVRQRSDLSNDDGAAFVSKVTTLESATRRSWHFQSPDACLKHRRVPAIASQRVQFKSE
jgi:hypothetical protein